MLHMVYRNVLHTSSISCCAGQALVGSWVRQVSHTFTSISFQAIDRAEVLYLYA